MAAGAPPYYKTAKELDKKIQEYFDTLPQGEPITITGLILHCGFCSRQSFYDYEEREEFSYTIKKARMRIENNYEKHLFEKSYPGAIFALKNFGWTDKSEVELSGNMSKPINIIKQYDSDTDSSDSD